MLFFILWSCQNDPIKTIPTAEKTEEVSPQETPITTATPQEKGPLRHFLLNDGSMISGYLIGTNREGFLVESDTLGLITIQSSKLKSMDLASNASKPIPQPTTQSTQAPVTTNNKTPTLSNVGTSENSYTTNEDVIEFSNVTQKQAISRLRDQMMQDPDILSNLYQLQNDPSFMALAQDPEILQLIAEGDLNALSNHPKMKKLEKSPALRNIFKELK